MNYLFFNAYFFITWVLIFVAAWILDEKIKTLIANTKNNKKALNICDVSCCDFALWLQDNYSTNKKQGEVAPLPRGYWRKGFTNDHYSTVELFEIYKAKHCS